MNEIMLNNQQLQALSLAAKAKLELADKAAQWFQANPGGTLDLAKQQMETLQAEIDRLEAERTALLQRILSTTFGGE